MRATPAAIGADMVDVAALAHALLACLLRKAPTCQTGHLGKHRTAGCGINLYLRLYQTTVSGDRPVNVFNLGHRADQAAQSPNSGALLRADRPGYLSTDGPSELKLLVNKRICHRLGPGHCLIQSRATVWLPIDRGPDPINGQCPSPLGSDSGCKDFDPSAFVFQSFHRRLALASEELLWARYQAPAKANIEMRQMGRPHQELSEALSNYQELQACGGVARRHDIMLIYC